MYDYIALMISHFVADFSYFQVDTRKKWRIPGEFRANFGRKSGNFGRFLANSRRKLGDFWRKLVFFVNKCTILKFIACKIFFIRFVQFLL